MRSAEREYGHEVVVIEGLEWLLRVVWNTVGCFGNIGNINSGVYRID